MHCKIYASDEGFGHLVRQSSIVSAIRKTHPHFEFTFQTERYASAIPKLIDSVTVKKRFNNITWDKQPCGAPDLKKIKSFYSSYVKTAQAYVEDEKDIQGVDFIVSDFVYEAFLIGQHLQIPKFGVAHFTWDWFFSKLFPPPISEKTLNWFFHCANQADALFFPPFTPIEILQHYRSKAYEVPLIVRELRPTDKVANEDSLKVLIMDSGSSLLREHISKASTQLPEMSDIQFYISSDHQIDAENVTLLDQTEIFSDYIPHMDLVISRAGFNTISECIAYRTPLLLLGEAVNPEMTENMLNIDKAQLGSILSLENFANNFKDMLSRFLDTEFINLQKRMREHEMPHNGAEVIAEQILNRLEG